MKGTTATSGCVYESTFDRCDCPKDLFLNQKKAVKCVLAGELEPRGCVEEGTNVKCECPYPIVTAKLDK